MTSDLASTLSVACALALLAACSADDGLVIPEGSVFLPDHPLHGHLEAAPVPDHEEEGTFRIKCSFSHLNYDDAIIYPGEQGRAHLHSYFGNVDADAHLTEESIHESSDSTCHGGPLNLSAYWVPTLLRPLYQRDGSNNFVFDGEGQPIPTGEYAIVYPRDTYVLDEHGVPVRDAMGHPVENENRGTDVYYKRASAQGDVEPMPPGLRMIAGTASATPASLQERGGRWACHEQLDHTGDLSLRAAHIPHCTSNPEEGDDWHLVLEVFFPQCWDGENLDAPDHKSHMAYPYYDGSTYRCPDAHPVWLPEVSYHIYFPLSAESLGPSGDTRDWFLSSDSYVAGPGIPGGASVHGDWFMAWNDEVSVTWTQRCINQRRHCANADLGNGFRMQSLLPGRGNDERLEVIERGHGHGAGHH